MSMNDLKKGAEIVGNAAAAKFDQISEKMGGVRDNFSVFTDAQSVINDTLIDKSDEHEDRLQALEDNRYFVRMSRHSLEDMSFLEQERFVAWIQKLVSEMNSRGFHVNSNQQAYLANLFKFLGIQDEIMQINSLDMLETFGDSNLHEAIYKVFLTLIYLYDNSFQILKHFEDIIQMFKLNVSDRTKIQEIMENERIPSLGIAGLIGMFDGNRPLNSFTAEALISRHVTLPTHPLLAYNFSREDHITYIKSFTLLSVSSRKFNDKQKMFLSALANTLQCPECMYEIDLLCRNHQQIDINKWQRLLDSEDKKYTWVLDAVFLASINDTHDANISNDLITALQAAKFPASSEFISIAKFFAKEEDPQKIFNLIKKIKPNTNGWEHILNFRGILLTGAFSGIKNKLNDADEKNYKLSWEIIDLSCKDMFNTMTSSDDEFCSGIKDKLFSKIGNSISVSIRSNKLKSLKKLKIDAEQLFESCSDTIYEANAILRLFGIEQITFNANELSYQEYELDNSASNENWYDDFSALSDSLQNKTNEFTTTVSLLEDQLSLFEKGIYHESIIAIRESEKAKKKKEKELEAESKRSVTLIQDGQKMKATISWESLADLPFNFEKIKHAASDGNKWVVLVDYTDLYFSNDGKNWTCLNARIEKAYYDKLKYEKSTWLLINKGNKYYYSFNGKDWHLGTLPINDDLLSSLEDLFFYDNQWVIQATKSVEYSYIKKGIIFDSKETGYYYPPVFFRSSTLQGQWTKWNEASNFPEGVILKNNSWGIFADTNILIASLEYDYSYKDDKKKFSADPYIAYLVPDKNQWKKATWPCEHIDFSKIFMKWNNHYICCTNEVVLSSNNGFEWSLRAKDIYTSNAFAVEGMLCLQNNNEMYLSIDGENFHELLLDNGSWNVISTNGSLILASFSPSTHEKFLKLGRFNFSKSE